MALEELEQKQASRPAAVLGSSTGTLMGVSARCSG